MKPPCAAHCLHAAVLLGLLLPGLGRADRATIQPQFPEPRHGLHFTNAVTTWDLSLIHI